MNSRHIEENFQKEVEFIEKKVSLGELSQDEGEFLIKQTRARADRELARLKRPGRLIFYIFTFVLASTYVFSFYLLWKKAGGGFYWPLWLLLATTLGFLAVLQIEIRRLETTFAQFFSRAWFERVLYAPRIEFEWQKQAAVLVVLQVRNESNLFAGLREEEICELRGRILDCVHDAFNPAGAILELVGDDHFVIAFPAQKGSETVLVALRCIQNLFSALRSHDGEWFSKSVRMSAGMVTGLFWAGTMGHQHRVYRNFGHRRNVVKALSQAAGWEEIFLDEDTAADVEKWVYVQSLEPIFLPEGKDLVRVCRLSGWKDSQ